MKNGCPTVKWISLLFLLAFFSSFNFPFHRTHAQNPRRADKISPDVLDIARGETSNARVPVIVQFAGSPDASFDSVVASNGGRVKARLANVNAKVIEISAKAAEPLASRPDVGFVPLDRPSLPVGHVTATTGADQIRLTNG